jgi:hypothetical protein
MRIVRRVLLPLLCGILLLFAGCGSPTTAVNTGIPADAAHPTPVDHTFHGCPPTGDGGDTQLNVRKNRVDDGENGSYHDVAMATILALTWPKDIERTNRANWSASDAAAVAQDEGIAVRVTGYIAGVKHEGTESTNCHDVDNRDFHVWLVAQAGDDRSKSVVVEVTPRVNALRAGWTSSALSGMVGKQVRISGWLMMDQEHPEQIGQTRATLWEVHPILHIEENSNGSWTSIDS